MFFIPLSQVESVELVVHALRVAGGQADCATCPARRVCTRQCLTIADSIEQMIQEGTLPAFDEAPVLEPVPSEPVEPMEPVEPPSPSGSQPESSAPARGRHLKVIK